MKADTVDGGNMNRAANDFFHLLQFAVELVIKVKDLFRRLVQFLTLSCEAKLFLASVDDQYTEVFLHRTELLANCRLGYPVEFCGSGKAFALDQVRKDFEVFNMHGKFRIKHANGKAIS